MVVGHQVLVEQQREGEQEPAAVQEAAVGEVVVLVLVGLGLVAVVGTEMVEEEAEAEEVEEVEEVGEEPGEAEAVVGEEPGEAEAVVGEEEQVVALVPVWPVVQVEPLPVLSWSGQLEVAL